MLLIEHKSEKNRYTELFAADASCLLEDRQLLDVAFKLVSPERAEKAERFISDSSKALSIGAELLLRSAIMLRGGQVSDIQFEYRNNGKPYLKNEPECFFNLSHSGHWVICAMSCDEVGCDIEEIKPGKRAGQIAGRYFTPKEQEFIYQGTSADEDDAEALHRFYRLWTLKESFMKVTGLGLALPLSDFSINVSETIDVTHKLEEDADYRFREFAGFDGYCCSVCSKGCDIDNRISFVSLRDHILSGQ